MHRLARCSLAMRPPLELIDLRRPGAPMAQLSVKLPWAIVDELDAMAKDLRVSRGAITRQLVIDAMGRLGKGINERP